MLADDNDANKTSERQDTVHNFSRESNVALLTCYTRILTPGFVLFQERWKSKCSVATC